MPAVPIFTRSGADDPFAPFFVSVSELTERIKRALETGFAEVAVLGELSNVARPKSGHIYFTLKDDRAAIRAVMWKADARRLAFEPADGLSVRSLGRLTVYPPRGDYQVVVHHLEPEGIGALELAFRQRYARLLAEGIFEPARKRALPPYPRRIVVVTSPSGAAVRDILQVVGRRWRFAEILIAPTRVQGAGAHEEVHAAIELANRIAAADMIVVARGGGSLEDLWTFNEEIVVRAIAGSRLPVVSAIGHEIDVTLADFAADKRALTPSEAGELCVPDVREVSMHLDRLADRLRLAGLVQLREARGRLEQLSVRARRALDRHVVARGHAVARLAGSLEALSPLGVLARGYSLTFRADGKSLIKSARDVQPGDLIRTRLGSGLIASRVVADGSAT
jgi:exodeoxyribonuclease VII large subunit